MAKRSAVNVAAGNGAGPTSDGQHRGTVRPRLRLKVVPPRGFGGVGSGSGPLPCQPGPTTHAGPFAPGSGSFPLGSGSFPLGGSFRPMRDGADLTVGLGWHPDVPDGRDQLIDDLKVFLRQTLAQAKKSAQRRHDQLQERATAAAAVAADALAAKTKALNALAASPGDETLVTDAAVAVNNARTAAGRSKDLARALSKARSAIGTATSNLNGSCLLNDADPTDPQFDLRTRTFRGKPWPVQDQYTLGACTAHAVTGLLEYLIYQGCGERIELSRLFLYKAARRLIGWTGDTGCYIRTTIRATARFGVPPEEQWPYDLARFDENPDGFLYAYAKEFQSLNYARFDGYVGDALGSGNAGEDTLRAVKRALRDGFPVAFGFPIYNSFATNDPDVPFPDLARDGDKLVGGHAVLAVGYDDRRPVVGPGGTEIEPGALLIRNSWGPDWGDAGYGYLPYEYVRQQLAVDFWTVFKQEWVNDEQFT